MNSIEPHSNSAGGPLGSSFRPSDGEEHERVFLVDPPKLLCSSQRKLQPSRDVNIIESCVQRPQS